MAQKSLNQDEARTSDNAIILSLIVSVVLWMWPGGGFAGLVLAA